jgi:hypothetical protein
MSITNMFQQHRAKALAIIALAGACGAAQAAPASKAEADAQGVWRAAMARTPAPQGGCFHAAYPSTTWSAVACSVAPARPYIPRHGHGGFTVGNGNDYAAVSSTLTSAAVGSFPVVTGVKTEKGYGGLPNTYSLQLNSDFMSTAGCNGTSNPTSCQTWEQFVYSSSERAAFMQYWLINYGSKCPAGGGWSSYSGSCYKNSAAVSVPTIPVTQLGSLSVSATAVANGNDTLVMTTASDAYSTTGLDSVVYLATAWTGSEFNVVGDGGGSEAKFNKKSSITVGIALTDGSSAAPACVADDGTTGETNNLKLGKCTVAGGTTPSVSFIESN